MAAYNGPPDAVDFSYDRVSGAVLKARGIKLAMRYLSHDERKNLTHAEALDLLAHGVSIGPNWESRAGRAREGYAAGVDDGRDSGDLADSIGIPHGVAIIFSADFDAQPGEYAAVLAYLKGCVAGLAGRYKVGVYASFGLIEYLNRKGFTIDWQTYAWSGNQLSPAADLYQYLNSQSINGAAVDYDKIIHIEELHVWSPAGVAQEDDMSDAQYNALVGLLAGLKAQISHFHEVLPSELATQEQIHAFALQEAARDAALTELFSQIETGNGVPVDYAKITQITNDAVSKLHLSTE